jgi:hypothetical protein
MKFMDSHPVQVIILYQISKKITKNQPKQVFDLQWKDLNFRY